ncbi:hypothetical protein JXL19_08610 [bacterium]|nr:hypothetical protein [bacterium]
MNESFIKKAVDILQNFFKIIGLWLCAALWWGLTNLSPMQFHNQIIKNDLPYICIGIFVFLLTGFWRESQNPSGSRKKAWIIPLMLVAAMDMATILYFKNITISFILTTLLIFMTGQITNLDSISQAGFLLFLSSIGFGITNLAMNLFRGIPSSGSGFFAHQVSFLLNIIGKNNHVVSGTLLFQDGKKITCDLIKMGLFPWLAFTLSFFSLIIIKKVNIRRKFIALIVSLFVLYLYLLGRFAIIAVITPKIMFAGHIPFNLYYWRTALISFLPMIPLWLFLLYECGLIEGTGDSIPCLTSIRLLNKDYWILGAMAVSVLFFTLSFYFLGFPQHQNIHCIIDEVHSEWESTLIDFNQDILGELAENSYHSFLDYIRHFHDVTILTDKPITAPLLEGVKTYNTPVITPAILSMLKGQEYSATAPQPVLILKCVTSPFTSEEIEAIKDFVFEGGGVFLIGDHTDVFFMNKHLNELSEHFGIRFEQNSVYFIDGGWVITDYSNYKIHPATKYLKTFIWATGDSLKVSRPAFPLIYSSHVCFADEVNYFYDNFFGNTKIDPEEIFGSFCIMAGARYGKGKVIAFTDSTCFNNYLMFTVGRRPLIAGVFRWLSDKGENFNTFAMLFCLSLFFLVIILIKRRLDINTLFYLAVCAMMIGWSSGYILSATLNSALYPSPVPIRQLPQKVILDSIHAPRHSMSFGSSESFLSPTSYDNLLFNIGRLDIFPEILYTGTISPKTLNNSSCLIIASPRKKFCEYEKANIKSFVENGGSLLLIEGANPDSSINQIANIFDINIRLDPYRNKARHWNEALGIGDNEALSINPAWVDGGDVLFEHNDMPVVCFKHHYKGTILAIGDNALFMKKNFMGFNKDLTDLQCDVIEALVNKDEGLLSSIDWSFYASSWNN